MTPVGSLYEWARFLDADSDDEAAAVLGRHIARIDAVYDDLTRCMQGLRDSPTGEITEALMVARMSAIEAAGMLESVGARFRAVERETA